MQPSNNMNLRAGPAVAGSRCLERFSKRHSVRARSILLAPKSAQPASRHANIRRIDMAIDVEVSLVTMHPLPNPVSQPTHRQNVARPIKRTRVALVQALAGKDLILDREQARVIGLECV